MSRPWIVAVTSDQHTNSTIGLCPSQGVKLDDGGTYHPSKAQVWLWDNWLDYHARIDALRKSLKAKLCYVVNGDSHDGDHHGSTQLITRNEESRAYIAHEVFAVPKSLKPDQVHVVRGTTAHVGGGAAADEQIGKYLKAVRDPETDAWSTWHLRLRLNDVGLDFKHHTSVGGLPWTAPGGIARLAFRIRWEYLDRGLVPPHLAIRSHKHVFADSGDAHRTRAIVTPAWQLKTEFVHKVAPEAIADIGGIAVIVHPEGDYEVKRFLYEPALPAERIA